MNKHSLRATILAILYILGVGLLPGQAQQTPLPGPPKMPEQFDQQTVQKLVQTIEEGQNSSLLKIGYFLRRIRHPLAAKDGLALVEAAANQEPVGTRRWFKLQSVQAFAEFRVQGASTDAGFKAYEAIFDHAKDSQKIGEEFTLFQTIHEFVFSVNGQFRQLGLKDEAQTRKVLLQAWKAYEIYLSFVQNKPPTREPQWAEAITRSMAEKDFLPIFEQLLNDPATPKSYSFLRTAAVVVLSSKVSRAIDLLQQAKSLLPPGDKVQARWLYTLLVDLLAQEDKVQQAAQAQEEYIAISGQGRVKLVTLYGRIGERNAIGKVVSALNPAQADEVEINNVIDAVRKLMESSNDRQKAELQQPTIELLNAYLRAPRTRNAEQELRARLSLADLLVKQNKSDEAQTVLRVDYSKMQPLNPTAQRYRLLMEQALNLLKVQ